MTASAIEEHLMGGKTRYIRCADQHVYNLTPLCDVRAAWNEFSGEDLSDNRVQQILARAEEKLALALQLERLHLEL
jgi:hypothetical protein